VKTNDDYRQKGHCLMQSDSENDDAELYTDELDPTFVNSRREACIIFCAWLVALCWCVPFCYLNGYNVADPENIPTTFGMPSWVVWGIAVPWIAADVFTVWFCFFYMKNDDLGVSPEELAAIEAEGI